MPSEFSSMMAAALPGTHYAVFGEPAVYTAPDGTTVALTIRIHRDEARQVERANGTMGEVQTGRIMCLASDLPKPIRDGRFTVDAVEVWTIETAPVLENEQHVCSCVRTGVTGVMPRRAKE